MIRNLYTSTIGHHTSIIIASNSLHHHHSDWHTGDWYTLLYICGGIAVFILVCWLIIYIDTCYNNNDNDNYINTE